jgi:hypothetical protein
LSVQLNRASSDEATVNEELTTYRINICFQEALEAEIAKLNKKAAKLGCQPAVLTIHGQESKTFKNKVTGIESVRIYNIVSVTGETPKLAGWKLVAAIERQTSGENLVSCVPGETIPQSYRTTDSHCDHCESQRQRKEVFVLKHDDGRYAQVGRNCISDFLGGASPESILAYAVWGFDVESVCAEIADEDRYMGGGRAPITYNIDEFLKTTAMVIRKLGWVSRTVASQMEYEGGPQATNAIVIYLLSPCHGPQQQRDKKEFIEKHGLVAEERDMTLATDALKWGTELPTNGGDYIYSLGVACRVGFVTLKTSGIVASLIAAYQRHLDKEAELNMKRAAEPKNRVHLGTLGERTGFAQVTIKAIRSFDSAFGVRTMIRFEDAQGSVLIWWKSGDTKWEEGETIDITGTVKSHEEYKGTPQTVLQRVSEGLPKPKKSKKTKAA